MPSNHNRASVVFRCRTGHDHQLCVTVPRGVPPELRCPNQQAQGFGGGGGGCAVPVDLQELVERELRESFQESKRRGFVLIEG